MLEQIFTELNQSYQPGSFPTRTTFYFSIDEIKKTLVLEGDSCMVNEGKTTEKADCVCVTNEQLFLKIWNEGYKPGMKDFLGGAIKSNAPILLQQLLGAFGR